MPSQDWAEPLKSVIVPLTPDRELHLEWMPDVLRHLGIEHQMVEWWNPLTSNWYCFETSFGVRVEEGEKHILFRRPAVAIKDFWEKEEREADTGTMEVVTYGHLLNHNVSHIPDLILAEVVLTDTPPETAAGDSASSLTDRFQRTQAHNFYRHFKSRRHTRVVQEILFPVTEAENSRQLVEVIRDAIQGMWSLPAWLLADGADTMNRSSVVRGS